MKLIDTSLMPPTKWTYVELATAHRFDAPDYVALLEQVETHRIANKLPRQSREEVTDDVHEQICSRSDCHVCKGADFEPVSLSARSVLNATKALLSESLVSLVEAERRADICRRCAFNQPMKGCFGIECSSAFAELFQTMNAGRITAHDEKLMGCQVCGCSCRAIVHFPMEALQSDRQHYFDRIPHCWRSSKNIDAEHQQG